MQPNPFGLTTPLTMPNAFGQPSTTPWLSTSQHHGSAERISGGGPGVYQHLLTPTPPRSASRGGRGRTSSRSRERRGLSPRNGDDEAPQQGWGPRIVSLERKVTDLQSQLSGADVKITKKFVDVQGEVVDLQGRADALERTLPQRCHMVEI